MYDILNPKTVRRQADGAFIPLDAANRDYREFAAWLEANPEAGAVDEPTPVIVQPAEGGA